MVLSQPAEHFHSARPSSTPESLDHGGTSHRPPSDRRPEEGSRADTLSRSPKAAARRVGDDPVRPAYLNAMLAGGLGGTLGDMLMHSLDTVKTRQQGDPHLPPKYTSMGSSYLTIWKQEGVRRGLYGGVLPAFMGSFAGTFVFFGGYEWSKRAMLDHDVHPTMAYLSAGFFADLIISPLYVPTEVLKTRLQLQGRHDNPFFSSGYNYRSSLHAFRTIYRLEGPKEFFSGYKATVFRDLPFSALQFAFYEKEQQMARDWVGSKDIGLGLEILTGASAGGVAGAVTCPMDVVKTRIQTELSPEVVALARKQKATRGPGGTANPATSYPTSAPSRPAAPTPSTPANQSRAISAGGGNTSLARHGQASLGTESVIKALRIIYRSEGLAGWFRGVGPRFVWTGMQSGTMLVVYQKLLKALEVRPLMGGDEGEGLRGV